MLDSLPIALLSGAILGTLAGLGVGGGSLLLLWLTAVLGTDQAAARCINLLFFIPTAVISSLIRRKQGALQLKKLVPAVVSGCIFAALGTLLSREMDLQLLKRLFGGLLIFTGLRELFYRPRNAR